MFNKLVLSACLIFPGAVLAHSGGTDKKGCHAGSKPYHCHGSKSDSSSSSSYDSNYLDSDDLQFMFDLTVGVQYKFENYTPFLGVSYYDDGENDDGLGLNAGVTFNNDFYLGFVTGSNTVQIGYEYIHFSFGGGGIGLGYRYPPAKSQQKQSASFYLGGSAILGGL